MQAELSERKISLYPVQSFKNLNDSRAWIEAQLADFERRIDPLLQEESDFRFIIRLAHLADEINSLVDQLEIQSIISNDPLQAQLYSKESQYASDWSTENLYRREDLYLRLKEISKKTARFSEEDQLMISTLFQRFEDEQYRSMKDAKAASQSFVVARLLAHLGTLEDEFNRSLSDFDTSLWFSGEELQGLRPEFIESLKYEAGRYEIRAASWHQIKQLMLYADRAHTRRRAQLALLSLGAEVAPFLAKPILQLRAEIVRLDGTRSWAFNQLDGLSIDTEAKLERFLLNSLEANKEAFERERSLALQEKKVQLRKSSAVIYSHDWNYYLERYALRLLEDDPAEIEGHFPIEFVIEKTFEQIEKTFGIRFQEIHDAPVWDPQVRAYLATSVERSEPIGLYYLDLQPRSRKSTDFFHSSLRQRSEDADGHLKLPTGILFGNFEKEIPLRFLRILFHEIGHALHDFSSRLKYQSLSGTNSKEDFLEAFPIFMESWALDWQFLQRISRHPETGRPLSDDQAKRLVSYLQTGQAHELQASVVDALVDFEIHRTANRDKSYEELNEIALDLYRSHFYPLNPQTQPIATSSHFVGYSSLYWVYVMGHEIAELITEVGGTYGESPLSPRLGRTIVGRLLSRGRLLTVDQIRNDFAADLRSQCRNGIEGLSSPKRLKEN